MDYCFVSPDRLIATEEVNLERVDELQGQILHAGSWTAPITAEKDAMFVMDGHHRLTVAHRLGLGAIPVILLDYSAVRVESWRPGETITPASIFAMARSGRKFPCKTTRHIFNQALPSCDVPLQLLYRLKPDEAAPTHAIGAWS